MFAKHENPAGPTGAAGLIMYCIVTQLLTPLLGPSSPIFFFFFFKEDHFFKEY